MARPGKAIFDVSMMAGWAFAAVLTGLVALSMMGDTGDTANGSGVVATLGRDDSRLVTGTVPTDQSEPATAAIDNSLVQQQNKTFNPFDEQAKLQNAQLQTVLSELRSLKREVGAFHVSTKRLRSENNLLKQRLEKLELEKKNNREPVRVVELPKREDTRNKVIVSKKSGNDAIDPQSTGSISPITTVPPSGQTFDPFAKSSSPNLKVSEQSLNMDLTVEGPSGRMVLPLTKPANKTLTKTNAKAVKAPKSQIISAPAQTFERSQTAFGLDLGQFVSLSDLGSAWKEVSISQRLVIGDLKPLTRVTQTQQNQLALDLVVGPIQNAARAAELCAQLKFRGYACKVSNYQGQALALR